jgi:hypothetical protein
MILICEAINRSLTHFVLFNSNFFFFVTLQYNFIVLFTPLRELLYTLTFFVSIKVDKYFYSIFFTLQ